MSIAQSMLPEFDHEMASTRRVLELIPETNATWKPHAKSFEIGKLALHLANLPEWMNFTLGGTEFDLDRPWHRDPYATTAKNLVSFEEAVAKGRAALADASDADMMVPWTLRKGDHVIFTMPRIAVVRSFVMNHMIHHRAQLTVYLRLLDIKVPGLYGPSADEM